MHRQINYLCISQKTPPVFWDGTIAKTVWVEAGNIVHVAAMGIQISTIHTHPTIISRHLQSNRNGRFKRPNTICIIRANTTAEVIWTLYARENSYMA